MERLKVHKLPRMPGRLLRMGHDAVQRQ